VIDGPHSVITELAYPETCLELQYKITKNINLGSELQGYWRVFISEGNVNMLANGAGFISIHRWRLWIIVRSINRKSYCASWEWSAEFHAVVCWRRSRWITLKYYRAFQTKELPRTAVHIKEAVLVQYFLGNLRQMIYLMVVAYTGWSKCLSDYSTKARKNILNSFNHLPY
jgi:hypothetical protein